MKVHRFISDKIIFNSAVRIIDPPVVHQIRTVLRLKIGESIILCDGMGKEAIGSIEMIEKNSIEVRCANPTQVIAEPDCFVTLYAALLKRDSFELIVQKAVEVGATKIVPLITERTIKTTTNLMRLRTIIREAAEQSGRGILAEIVEPVNFLEALINFPKNEIGVFCQMGGSSEKVYRFAEHKRRGIFIGPEGGWSDTEIKAAEKKLDLISFGALTMRAETAAIIAAHWAVTQK
jgi:16S rRNA (uracil1498-N3)-methyltransferase